MSTYDVTAESAEIEETAMTAAAHPPVRAAVSKDERVNILMVDDQPGKLLSYEAILRDLGENLIKANSGREALDQLLKNDIAVILMDVSMPELDGFQLADLIRSHPRFHKMAILFISAVHLSDLDRLKGYERGAVDYISVPIIPDLLRAKVSVFAELHRKSRQLERLNRELEQRVADRTQELVESETQFRTLANSIPQLAWIAHSDGSIFWFNQRWYDYTGTSLADVQGWGWKMLQHPEHAERVTRGLRRCCQTGETWEDTFPLRGADGQYSWFLSRSVPIRDSGGRVVRWFGTSTDVSAQKQMEDVLRERVELLDLASEAILVLDGDNNLRFWNTGAENLYGWKRSEVLGKNVREILGAEFPPSPQDIEAALARDGRWQGNIVHYTREGTRLVLASRQVARRDAEGNITATLEINRDITSQLMAEEMLRRTERLAAMGRVAGIIAHEINNPLEAILNAFYLLKDHPSLDNEARLYARMGEDELTRLAHITRQTLSFYRESEHPIPVSIAEVLDNVLELQSRPLKLAGISLQKKYGTSACIEGFPGELKQVFLNLVGNAIHAMPHGGRLRIHIHSSSRAGAAHPADMNSAGQGQELPIAAGGERRRTSLLPGVRISICDTGSGVLPEHAKRLFEPFFSTKQAKGTGLGLWISRGIVQKYEGSIRFRSVRTGKGSATCFSVYFPLAAAPAAAELASAAD